MSAQNTQILNKLVRTQAENEKMKEAIADFRKKKEAVDNSQSDAFGHQGKRVQRRQYELREAREKLYSFLENG